MSFTDDLLDLCTLNQLEDSGVNDETQQAIDFSKKRVMTRIRFAPQDDLEIGVRRTTLEVLSES